ncbi:hypothetical protein TREES_T100001709 [Tupaia chinensis]|uniref:Uncharacterized protein n=1 Tax=Tupaia chinensis TaxID=246437 RepID=L9KP08_TUPCH|nr:hypothetical protein TREES_T100001709 [Tupaia chinensis]
MHRGPCTVLQEPICCECQIKFGGRLPVPRAEAALPYWVPESLRPQKQIQKMIRFYIPRTTKVGRCPCPCHRFGGCLPVPRNQAAMPYWVPQVLRSQKKVVKRLRSFKGVPETPLDLRPWHSRWRVCCEKHLLLKWQQLQALHQEEPVGPGLGASAPASLLPFGLSLLTLLQAILKVITAIRLSPFQRLPRFSLPCLGLPRQCEVREGSSTLLGLIWGTGHVTLKAAGALGKHTGGAQGRCGLRTPSVLEWIGNLARTTYGNEPPDLAELEGDSSSFFYTVAP